MLLITSLQRKKVDRISLLWVFNTQGLDQTHTQSLFFDCGTFSAKTVKVSSQELNGTKES